MTRRAVVTAVIGAVAGMVGVGLTVAALTSLAEARDADGFYMGDPFPFDRPGRAIVTDDIDLLKGRYPDLADDLLVLYLLDSPVDVRIQGATAGTSPLFMGIAPASAVDGYLEGVAHDVIISTERHRESHQIQGIEYTAHEGTRVPSPPDTETFWTASAVGSEPLTLDWAIEDGNWTFVIMNADTSTGVTAELAFGAAPPSDVESIGRAMLAAGLFALIGGGLLLLFGLRRLQVASRRVPPATDQRRQSDPGRSHDHELTLRRNGNEPPVRKDARPRSEIVTVVVN